MPAAAAARSNLISQYGAVKIDPYNTPMVHVQISRNVNPTPLETSIFIYANLFKSDSI
jgi:hypothetical protein